MPKRSELRTTHAVVQYDGPLFVGSEHRVGRDSACTDDPGPARRGRGCAFRRQLLRRRRDEAGHRRVIKRRARAKTRYAAPPRADGFDLPIDRKDVYAAGGYALITPNLQEVAVHLLRTYHVVGPISEVARI